MDTKPKRPGTSRTSDTGTAEKPASKPGKPVTPAAQAFTQFFVGRALRTLRLVTMLEDDDLVVRPTKDTRSTAQLIAHICALHDQVRSLLEDAEPSPELSEDKARISCASDAVRALKHSINEVKRAAHEIPAAQWDQPVETFGAKMLRRQLVYLVLDHEVHHCGQLYVYLRIAGKQPPMLFSPLDESLLS